MRRIVYKRAKFSSSLWPALMQSLMAFLNFSNLVMSSMDSLRSSLIASSSSFAAANWLSALRGWIVSNFRSWIREILYPTSAFLSAMATSLAMLWTCIWVSWHTFSSRCSTCANPLKVPMTSADRLEMSMAWSFRFLFVLISSKTAP